MSNIPSRLARPAGARSRELGERLIRTDYAKHARALAAVLQKVAAIDALIVASNAELHAAGRQTIPESNAIRCTPSQWVEFVERRTVHVNDPRHPLHGLVQSSMSGRSYCRIDTKAPVDSSTEMDIEGRDLIGGQYPHPLYAEINLPTIDPMPLVPGDGRMHDVEQRTLQVRSVPTEGQADRRKEPKVAVGQSRLRQ